VGVVVRSTDVVAWVVRSAVPRVERQVVRVLVRVVLSELSACRDFCRFDIS
jgi:hypothetical protein